MRQASMEPGRESRAGLDPIHPDRMSSRAMIGLLQDGLAQPNGPHMLAHTAGPIATLQKTVMDAYFHPWTAPGRTGPAQWATYASPHSRAPCHLTENGYGCILSKSLVHVYEAPVS
ncbi:hypothetical protein AMTR_s00099p00094660 [Amborella trichopoda]|uniref:Uncharacterized protein n=1 Tax=Amborella trichopoda TaxID=13333 RepID=W1NVU2_AMBTC|nr:hypothetical protein AMTR_s00099p00094660 [Amborella trichopoda]